jgi:hypothetical protein
VIAQTIVVSGMVAAVPGHGGATWAVMQYLLGFARLGYEVYFVEPVAPAALQPSGCALAGSLNARYFRHVTRECGFEGRAALLLEGTDQTVGVSYAELRQAARRASVVVNIAGMLRDAALLEPAPCRVYLDLDPGFTQLWHTQGIDMRFGSHTHFVTVGNALGGAQCPIPTCGVSWITTLQPVVLERWPAVDGVVHEAFTTVANWRGYGSIEHDGVQYGQKAHSLRRFMTLPTLTTEKFVLALSIDPGEKRDVEALVSHGWQLIDPAVVASTPARYQQFIRQSKAEFGIAKSGYVAGRTGWFSDRSVCYLASGRPVLAQETGFSRFLPTGAGLFAFETADDVLAAIETLRKDYARHARAARAIAEERFDSDLVLNRLLAAVGQG